MRIEVDDLARPQVQSLLTDHFVALQNNVPVELCRVLDLKTLRLPSVTVFTAWQDGVDGVLLGCGALKEIDPTRGEIKSMRTAPEHLRKGVATNIALHLVREAQRRGYSRVSLETGRSSVYEGARRLYTSIGFEECDILEGYVPNPRSIFMDMELQRRKE
ncbi:putative GNAT family N-acetyltransferase [Rhizodiscina lignyota]|uniref:GNAT family N-acetyltransferase n=1 Tax=Rhizodiscina lignyota TaxID=1504668 RepID=A0A9P4IJM0_9PEZI|nr:putative GNAT family N-acetyltransferase [Rhizodiscina lignyota]